MLDISADDHGPYLILLAVSRVQVLKELKREMLRCSLFSSVCNGIEEVLVAGSADDKCGSFHLDDVLSAFFSGSQRASVIAWTIAECAELTSLIAQVACASWTS